MYLKWPRQGEARKTFSVPKMARPGIRRLHILRGAFIFKGETQKLERIAHLGAKPAAELAKRIKTRSGMLAFFEKCERGAPSGHRLHLAPPAARLLK